MEATAMRLIEKNMARFIVDNNSEEIQVLLTLDESNLFQKQMHSFKKHKTEAFISLFCGDPYPENQN